MAQAPTLEQNVFPEQGPLPNASGADFGAQVGEAQQGLGQAVSGVGDVAFKHVMQIQGLKNEATASDMDVQFQGDLGTLEDNYYSLKGKAAADAYPQFQSDLTALRSKYLTAAPNPMVQNMLQQSVGYSVGRSLRESGRYAGTQTRQWMINSSESRNQLLVAQGIRNYGDPEYQQQVSAALDAGAKNYAELNGLDPDSEALYREKLDADLQKGRIANAKAHIQGLPIAQQAAALLGVQPGTPQGVGGDAYHRTVLAVEFGSGQNDPNNPHQGPVQADNDWWNRFGRGGDRNNTQDALKALDLETSVNKPQLQSALGRQVTDADLYLAHQQGLKGAVALLTHPDAPASESVPLANIAGNIPHDANGQPVADASTITGADFAALWTKPFEAAGTNGVGQGTTPSAQDMAAVNILPDNDRQALTKSALESWRVQSNAAYTDQQRQQAAAIKLADQQQDQITSLVQQQIVAYHADPTKPPPDLLGLSQNPAMQNDRGQKTIRSLFAFENSVSHPPTDTSLDNATTAQLYRSYLNGSATTKDFQEAFAPSDGSAGKISLTHLNFLMGAAQGSKTDPDAESTKALKSSFLSKNESSIGTAGNAVTPDSEYRFNFDFEKAWADKVAKGENPKDLITPGNKDYFGSLANLSHYSQTAADQLKAEADAQKPGLWERLFGSGQPAIPPELPTGTTFFGKTKDGRDVFLRPDGQKVALPPPAAPAGAPAPIAVDTGPAAPLAP